MTGPSYSTNEQLAAALGGTITRDGDGHLRVEIPAGGIGDNSRAGRDTAGDNRLRLLIERIERLEEEKKGIADDIKDVFGELKAVGYDAKIARQILRLRRMAPDDRREMEMLLETYKCAVGMD